MASQFIVGCSLFQRRNDIANSEFPLTRYDLSSNIESALALKKSKELYFRILPWISEDEKMDFLSLNSYEAQRSWVQKNQIFNRQSTNTPNEALAIENKDIYIGMQPEYVRKSWGDPVAIETAGNPLYRNERWKYIRQIATEDGFEQQKRYVYFEDGKVVGWEKQ